MSIDFKGSHYLKDEILYPVDLVICDALETSCEPSLRINLPLAALRVVPPQAA